MTRQTKSLFRPEVYEAMQERLQGSSAYRGAEEAFDMFYADRALQDFLRVYAKKEDIIEIVKEEERRKDGYCPTHPRFSQAGKNRSILLIDDSKHQAHNCGGPFGAEKSGIYIGPRQNQDAALMIYTHLGDIISHQSTGLAEGEIVKEDTWKIKVFTYFGGGSGGAFDGESFPVSQAPLFQRISKSDILTGIERAIEKLIRKG